MIRTQIQLTEAQAAALREAAHRRGMSVSALLREAADALLTATGPAVRERALAVVGSFASGQSDIGQRHDEHLADAFR